MNDYTIDPTARIDVDDFKIGAGSIIRAGVRIEGSKVHLGRETFLDEGAVIGGGSNRDGSLVAGDWFHMGMYSQINTARAVVIGDEVGIGIGTRLFTHGAYLSEYDGFPCSFDGITIGSRVWLPNAIVMPGTIIGDDVVVAAGSVVAGTLDGGCLYGGTPAIVIKRDCYPEREDRFQHGAILERIAAEAKVQLGYMSTATALVLGNTETVFDLGFDAPHRISGEVTDESERLRHQLRRHGIRFRYSPIDGEYQPWTDE